MPYSKENRRYYLSIGKCPRCGGENPVIPGQVLCRECREKANESDRARVERYKAEGRCRRCGTELGDDWHVICKSCRDKKLKYRESGKRHAQKRRDDLREEGKCIRCGIRYAEGGKTMCQKCLDKQKREDKRYDPDASKKRQRRQERIEKGLCIDCSRPTENGHTRCPKCLKKARDSQRKYAILKKIDREAEAARKHAAGT